MIAFIAFQVGFFAASGFEINTIGINNVCYLPLWLTETYVYDPVS